VTATPCACDPGAGASNGSACHVSPSSEYHTSFALPAGSPCTASPLVYPNIAHMRPCQTTTLCQIFPVHGGSACRVHVAPSVVDHT
jgi:hypothetical protein